MASFVSYAQNFEDVMLWRALSDIEQGSYVDIGAHDPRIDSVSRAFYERGWRGIHVEPIAQDVERLKQDRPDEIVIQAAVSDQRGTVVIHEMSGLSTGIDAIAKQHGEHGIPSRQTSVAAVTLDDVLAELGAREIHWMKIDVEGMEKHVLLGWKGPSRPWIVVVESTLPNSSVPNWNQWEPLLLDKGYEFVYFDGLNRFYLSPAHTDRKTAFAAPPNVFDGFALQGDSSAPFCGFVNQQAANREQELKRQVESLGSAISVLQDSLDAREREHREQLRGYIEHENILSEKLSESLQEIERQKELRPEAALARERLLELQFRNARRQFLVLNRNSLGISNLSGKLFDLSASAMTERQRLLDAFSAREERLHELLAAAQSELAVLTKRLLEREQGFAESREQSRDNEATLRLALQQSEHAHRAEIDDVRAAADLRERVLQQDIARLGADLDVQRERLRSELRDSAQAHRQALDVLRSEMIEQGEAMTAAALHRESVLRTEIEHLERERDRAIQEGGAREESLRNEISAIETNQIRVLQALREALEEHSTNLARVHADREQALREEIMTLHAERSSMHEIWVGHQQEVARLDQERQQARLRMQEQFDALGQELLHVTREKAALDVEVSRLQGTERELLRLRETLAWRILAPLLALRLPRRPARRFPLPGGTDAVYPLGRLGDTPSAPIPASRPVQSDATGQHIDHSSEFESVMKKIAHVNQLLDLAGLEFVESAYQVLLNRSADHEGAGYYLNRLRKGYGKRSVIAQIMRSVEARAVRSQLPGLAELLAEERSSRHWLWGMFQRRKDVRAQMNRLEYLYGQGQAEIHSRVDVLELGVERVHAHLDELMREMSSMQAQLLPGLRSSSDIGLPTRDEFATGGGNASTGATRKASIVRNLDLPVHGTPREIIDALKDRIASSREASQFVR
ncbi:FkbM family methyltransferase [Burkholderia gladioli]|uniref:FkbM family methyltransferase n=1 Tax=Burkholderia gladioli TaxID=28095 RepID=UPI0016409230|nr:FkbM family methyltransferase [Burkholderia gladioli]